MRNVSVLEAVSLTFFFFNKTLALMGSVQKLMISNIQNWKVSGCRKQEQCMNGFHIVNVTEHINCSRDCQSLCNHEDYKRQVVLEKQSRLNEFFLSQLLYCISWNYLSSKEEELSCLT